MNTANDLTIVTSCSGYGKYLRPWAESIVALTVKPRRVVILTHGTVEDRAAGVEAANILSLVEGLEVGRVHHPRLDFGVARNKAVELSTTEWVMHLDCDDRIMPHALEDFALLAPNADVVSFGYERAGEMELRPKNKTRLYRSGTGLEMLQHLAPCSGVSPYRRSLWEKSPYRTDMKGAWDTALWIGFARLGARFRATRRPCFWYWHHPDSIYTQRRITYNWTHAYTGALLGSLRRDDKGVAVIVPRDSYPTEAREEAYNALVDHYHLHHSDWPIYEGFSDPRRWVKGDAIADALTRCPSAEILVITDADVVLYPEALALAVHQVKTGIAPWAIPHGEVYRLSRQATPTWIDKIVSGHLPLPIPAEDCLARDPYMGYAGGGVVVVRRFHYEAVGGIPRAFEGWGGEDTSLAAILDTMVGKHRRGTAPLLHLWHEPQVTKQTPAPNHRRYRQLNVAAHKGPDALWAFLQTMPNPPRAKQKGMPPWKARSLAKKKAHGVDLASRQGYLGRGRKAGGM